MTTQLMVGRTLSETRKFTASYSLSHLQWRRFSQLSHMSGALQILREQFLNGNPVTVRKNLWDFLVYYRSHVDQKYFWVDALCINQDHLEERNHQVTMMGQIYRSAKLVIAWISLEYERDLKEVVFDFDRATPLLDERDDHWLDDGEGQVITIRGDRTYTKTLEHARTSIRDYLGCVSESEYWNRVWIVQEFTVGSRLEIQAGRSKLNVDYELERLEERSSKYAQLELFYWNFVGPANGVVYGRRRHRNWSAPWGRSHHRPPIMQDSDWFSSANLIAKFKHSNCSDVRDRVYALLGLIEPKELELFPIDVDYSRSAGTLFFELCNRWKQQMGKFGAYVSSKPIYHFADDLREALELP